MGARLCERGGPIGDGFEPLISGRAENCDEPVTLFGGVVEQDGVVCTLAGRRQVCKTSFVASPDVLFRNVVAACENSISDSSQIDLDIFVPM